MASLHEGDVVVWPGDMQAGGAHRRTCVVVSAEVNNKLSPTLVLLPLTSDLAQRGNLLRPLLTATRANGLRADSLALCEQPVTLPATALEGPYGRIDPDDLELLRGRLGWVLGIEA
jgi:mRNA-degrading endonuclease toxin of MazEF toxin-antitoxin module